MKNENENGKDVSHEEKEQRTEYSSSVDQVETVLGSARERKLVRKLDLHIIPVVMALYLLSFLDRVNIGNARLYHLESDLGLTGNQFQSAVSLLFVTYVIFELPSNMVIKKFTPSRWIALITILWGIVATLTGLVNNYAQLIACRLLMGAMEAGLFPGLALYLSFFYNKHELALRLGYLFVSSAIAGGVGGLLAFAIGHLDGVQGMSGWRWILIIEGLPTVVLGITVLWLLPNDPETAYFLNEEERTLMITRRNAEYGQTVSAQEFNKGDAIKALKDWKIWVWSAAHFCVINILYAFSTFLPTIISGLGKFSTSKVQVLTIPCYATGAICFLVVAYISDKTQKRAVFVIGSCCCSITGYAILISNAPQGAHYFACFMVAAGCYINIGIPLAWLQNNNPRYGKRATGSGLQITIGNCAGILAPFIYPKKDGPKYVKGHAITMALCACAVVLYTTLWVYLSTANKKRADGKEDHAVDGMTDEQLEELGDESPRYRFTV